MKYDHLRELPVSERPKMLTPVYCREYLSGQYLCFLLLLVLPIIANAVIGGVILQQWWAVLSGVIGLAGVSIFHIAISSGMISSNIGTYFRESEPTRFWISCFFVICAIILPSIGVWFI